jgi:hypothetical protein
MQLIEYLLQVSSIIQTMIKEDATIDVCFTIKSNIHLHMVMDSSFLYFIYEDANGSFHVSNTICTKRRNLITKECIIWEPEVQTDIMGFEMIKDAHDYEVK